MHYPLVRPEQVAAVNREVALAVSSQEGERELIKLSDEEVHDLKSLAQAAWSSPSCDTSRRTDLVWLIAAILFVMSLLLGVPALWVPSATVAVMVGLWRMGRSTARDVLMATLWFTTAISLDSDFSKLVQRLAVEGTS